MNDANSDDYRPRLIDDRLELFLQTFGAVLVEGPKWCGKTWTGRHHAQSVAYIDNPDTREQAEYSPSSVLDGDRPRLVDEWQDVPKLWDSARRIIDDSTQKGLFIFTGSAVPPDQATSHSGTGRFVPVRMRPMSLYELGQSTGSVSLVSLFAGETINPDNAASSFSYEAAITWICRGGWPAGINLPDRQALQIPVAYLKMVTRSDASRADGARKSPIRVTALLRSLARHTATQASSTTIHRDITESSRQNETMAISTMRRYMEALEKIFVIDDLPAWRYSLRSKAQLYVKPKHHLADPSLAVAALQANPATLQSDPKTVGFLFESMCVRDLRAYVEAVGGEVSHYRDNTGLEADAIVTTDDGRWGAFEIKLGRHQYDEAARNLLRVKAKLSEATGEPSFLAVVTATGGVAHTRSDGVHVVPLDCLGP